MEKENAYPLKVPPVCPLFCFLFLHKVPWDSQQKLTTFFFYSLANEAPESQMCQAVAEFDLHKVSQILN